jgi:hypothetical protein
VERSLGPKPVLQQLYCDAHKNGVKVLEWSEKNWNGSQCGVTQLYSWCRENSPQAYNSTAILEWAESSATCIAATGFDGVMLDAEGAYTVTHPKLRAAVTAGVCALKSALNKALPGSVLYWTVDTGNYFDYKTMIDKQCVDMFLDMDYCLCNTDSRANAPLERVNRTAEIFKGFGVPPEKLGIIFPWFGCVSDRAAALIPSFR